MKALLGRLPPKSLGSVATTDSSDDDMASVDSRDLSNYGVNADEVEGVVLELKRERARNQQNDKVFGHKLQEGWNKAGKNIGYHVSVLSGYGLLLVTI
jgi:hypothetical protein